MSENILVCTKSWQRASALFVGAIMSFALLFGAAIDAAAQTRIKVLVNGQPITTYDIQQRARLMQLIGLSGGNATKAAEDELIDEMLQAVEARRLGVSVSNEQADSAFASIAARNNAPVSQLEQAIKARGVSVSAFKRRLKAQLTWRQVVQRRSGGGATFTTQDLIAELRDRSDEFDFTAIEVNLTQIMLVVPASGPFSNPQKRMRDAENLRKQFASCEQGMELVKQMPEVVVRFVGVRTSAELTGPSGEAVLETPVGQLSPPTRNRTSIDMFAVCERREIQSTAAAQAKLKLEMDEGESEIKARRLARDLRKNAIIEYK